MGVYITPLEDPRKARTVYKELEDIGDDGAFYFEAKHDPFLACHGWEAVHENLNRLSKEGRWDDVTNLISDDILNEFAVLGERRDIAGKLRAGLAGIADGVSIVL